MNFYSNCLIASFVLVTVFNWLEIIMESDLLICGIHAKIDNQTTIK